MQLVIMWSSPTSRNFFSLGTNILSTLFSSTFGLCSSLNVREKVSHLYKTKDKLCFFNILIF